MNNIQLKKFEYNYLNKLIKKNMREETYTDEEYTTIILLKQKLKDLKGAETNANTKN